MYFTKLHFLFTLSLIVFLSIISTACSQSTPNKEYSGVELKTIHSNILNEDQIIYIYSPSVTPESNYPVIYLLDGEMSDTYGEILKYTEDNPHIIVGIETVKNRNRNMTPTKIEWRSESGGADLFLQFLNNELQPFIDLEYKSNGKNILIGASNAGLFTIYAMLSEPEKYFAYISISPTIGFCNNYMTNLVHQFSPKNKLNNKSLYISYGLKREMPEVTEYVPSFYKLLSNKFDNLSIDNTPIKDAGHVPMEGFTNGLKYIYNQKNFIN